MGIKNVTTADVRRMNGTEALIIQGCGGDLQEWADGINDQLTEAGILRNGSRIENCFTFTNDGITCLGFSLDDADADLGKLAMWRLQTHEQFYGTWLSDYVPNRLGGFITENEQTQKKPDCPLIGEDSNVFNLMGIASRTLRRNGMAGAAKEMCERITSSGSYDEALGIIGEYVNITSVNDEESEEIGMEMS